MWTREVRKLYRDYFRVLDHHVDILNNFPSSKESSDLQKVVINQRIKENQKLLEGPSTPKKLSGKEIEELKKMEIRQSMMTASSSNYVILDDEDQSFIKSERLRHELKNLQIGDDDTPARVPKRERRAVELDINIDQRIQSPYISSFILARRQKYPHS